MSGESREPEIVPDYDQLPQDEAKQRALQASRPPSAVMGIDELVEHVSLVQQVAKRVMKEDTHYGVIPGTKKPTLLKAGAEILCVAFRLDPEYQSEEIREGKHLTVKSRCTLYHAPTGRRMGSGEGSCSTMETRYAFRNAERTCPDCGGAFIIKGKDEYGGGWLCYHKKGGCGAKFKDGDSAIEDQETGKVENPNLADVYNSVLKVANKRSLTAATLNVTGASDTFTQDMEDMPRSQDRPRPQQPKSTPPVQRKATRKAAPRAQEPTREPDPLPPENDPEDKTEGFGADDLDRKVTEQEWKMFVSKCHAKSQEPGVKTTGSGIQHHILAQFGDVTPRQLTLGQLEEALTMAKHWKDADAKA